MDLLKYLDIIKEVVSHHPKYLHDDLTNECCRVLLERGEEMEEDSVREICGDTVNGMADYRRYRRRKDVSLSSQRIYNEASHVPQPSNKELSQEMKEAISRLSPQDQEVIRELYIEGRTEEETAQKLGLTRDAVQYRKKRGLAAIRKYYEVG